MNEELHHQIRRVSWKGSAVVVLFGAFAALLLVSTTWLSVREVQLTTGLKRTTDHVSSQQATLDAQQKSITATQAIDALSNCNGLNASYAAARYTVRQEALVQIGQALKLYQRTQATLAVNPPKNAAARAARVISDRFLRSLVSDTVTLSATAIRNVDARTKPLDCTSTQPRNRRSP